jgi:hypothetical protein
MSEMNKQDKIVEMVKAGTFTREEIINAAGCTVKAFASYLTTMRNAAKFTGTALCPKEVELDGKRVMTVDTFEAVMAGREERKASAKPGKLDSKTPAEIYNLAAKRVTKARTAVAKYEERIATEGKPAKGTELWLRNEAAKIEQQLAELLFNALPVPEAMSVEEPADLTDVPAEGELL